MRADLREIRRFIAFALVGVVGFAVDAGVLYLGLSLGLGLRFGRIVSYLAAVTTTWALNRVFTFKVPSGRGLWAEWARFSVSQLGGATANLGVYYVLIRVSPMVAAHPVLGVAAGSLSGLALNYAVARVFVFGRGIRYNATPHSQPSGSNIPYPWRSAAAWLLLVGAFIWPALLNGQPFFFPDTTTYIRGADAGIQAAFHHKSAWSIVPDGQKSVSSIEEKTVLTGRSPYYGALLYLGDLTGGFWLSVAVQAAAVLLAIGLALRAAGIDWWPRGFWVALGVAGATTAPFFSSLLMPDVFAGVAILAAAVLLSAPQRCSRADYAIAFVLLAAATACHDSHVLILFSLGFLGFLYAVAQRSARNWAALAVIAASLAVGLLAQSAFYAAVKHVVGVAPLRPPFLMARSIEDGPGLRYIRATCPANGFKVCEFADRLPLIADDFLWKMGPTGIFASAPAAVRRELSDEQLRFLLAVIAHDPWAQFSASLKDAVAQLTELGLSEFQYTDLEKAGFAAKVPAEHLRTLQASAAFRGTMPLAFFGPWVAAVVVLAAIVVAWTLLLGRRAALRPELPRLALWLVAGIVVNAVVCGILSGPHDRYSARVAWLLPLAALLVAATLRSGASAAAGPARAV